MIEVGNIIKNLIPTEAVVVNKIHYQELCIRSNLQE